MRAGIAVVTASMLMVTVGAVGAGAAGPSAPGEPQDALALEASDDVRVVTPDHIKGQTEGYWIVTLDDAPLATYAGGIDGLAATTPAATGAARIDVEGADAQAYIAHLDAVQDAILEQIAARLGRQLDVAYRYTNALNGFAVWLTPAEASTVLRVPGVATIVKNRITQLTTDLGPRFIGAAGIWDGTATGVATQGEGVVVGVLDSGINPENPSFLATGSDGYTHTNPNGDGVYFGACDPASAHFQPDFVCNAKLIGAYDFFVDDDGAGRNSLDHDGHGSHTASTAAGNVVEGVGPDGATISGVAPHANIISYRTCGDDALGQGYCTTAGAAAAVDQAVEDGVDVLNYSIGSESPDDPWTAGDDLAFLNARAAGIFVAHSAGNEGPGAATVGSPAAPWVAQVAAMTHDRPSLNSLDPLIGGSTPPPASPIVGRSGTTDAYTDVVVYAGDLPDYILARGAENNGLCAVGSADDGVYVSPWEPGTFEGEIVICDRGSYDRVEKSENAAASGAGGFIMADDGGGEVADFHVIPGIHVDQAEGQAIKDWVTAWNEGSSDPQPTATITPAIADPDATAGFSSRGPNRSTGGDTLMPTIAAPGVSIWAAHGKYGETTYTFLSGTSMASPHVAGAAALMSALHPDWSPAAIQSAIETTAVTADLHKEDGFTPADVFDVGAGRVQIDVAAAAALVLDESEADYMAANPSDGGDPTTINNPALANGACLLQCSFVRTVTSTASAPVTWNVGIDFAGPATADPATFTLAPGASQDITFTLDVASLASGAYVFGRVDLVPDAAVPAAHFPIAVQPQTGDLPGEIDLVTRRDAGSDLVRGLTAIEITDFVAAIDGLAKAELRTEELAQDPTNGDPFDTADGTFTQLVEVPAGTTRAVFEITAAESLDADLYVGLDANGDGLASAAELVAQSTSPTAAEKVVLDGPAPGTYWVLVQNWTESAATPDSHTLAWAILDGSDAGNARVEGPASQGQLEPFDLRVFWDLDDAAAGDIYYGWVALGTDPANSANIGTVPITLRRAGDDVTKTAAVSSAKPGEVVSYEITIAPNVLSEDLAYTVVDTLPEGLTLVDGSATASAGDLQVGDGQLTWTGVLPTTYGTEGSYSIITNIDDPDVCQLPLSPTYIDLASFGIAPNAAVSGDSVVYSAFSSAPPTEFYDDPTAGVSFTDDGFAFFDSTPGPFPFAPTPIGQPAWYSGALEDPSDFMAPFWTDMEIHADPAGGRGVSLATLGDPVVASVIEFDRMEQWAAGADPIPGAPTLDFEIFNWHTIDDTPGAWEFAFAYDNVAPGFAATGFPVDVVIGVENETGDAGTEYFSGLFADGVPIQDELVICFDFVRPQFDPVTITYDATVDPDTPPGATVNSVVSSVDNPGSTEQVVSAAVEVLELSTNDLLTNVRDEADAYESGRRVVDRLVDNGVKQLEKALDQRNWDDGDTLDRRRGSRVFSAMLTASIQFAIADALTPDDLSSWNDQLVDVSRQLARDAIDAGRSTWLAEIMFGLAERTNNPQLAIIHYGIAWQLAQR